MPSGCVPYSTPADWKLTLSGILYHGRDVSPSLIIGVQHKGKYRTSHCQCNVSHRLLRWLHRLSPTMDEAAALLQRRGHGHCQMVLVDHLCVWLLVSLLARQQTQRCEYGEQQRSGRESRSGHRYYRQGGSFLPLFVLKIF
jgi:hypothetical protein